jgi:hypothetical protein
VAEADGKILHGLQTEKPEERRARKEKDEAKELGRVRAKEKMQATASRRRSCRRSEERPVG